MPIMAEQETKKQYRIAKLITEHNNHLTALLVAQSQDKTGQNSAIQNRAIQNRTLKYKK